MTEEKENFESESCRKSFALFKDLLLTLSDSELVKTGENNKHLAFDVMLALGELTAVILKMVEKASKAKEGEFSVIDFYKDNVLQECFSSADTFISLDAKMAFYKKTSAS